MSKTSKNTPDFFLIYSGINWRKRQNDRDNWRQIRIETVSKWCGVHIKTVQRWQQGKQEPPLSAIRLIQILAFKRFPWDGWQHFGIDKDNHIFNDQSRARFSQGFLLHPGFTESLATQLKYELDQLRHNDHPQEPPQGALIIPFADYLRRIEKTKEK